MTKLLFSIDPLISIMFIFFGIIIFLIFYLLGKMQAITVLRKELTRLNETLQDLDQQSKLIIKNDMELKLYQQEIESMLNKLTLIRNIITSSLHILNKENIFFQINERVINSLGFKKGLILDFTDLVPKSNIGFRAVELEAIKEALKYKNKALKEMELLPSTSEIYKRLSSSLHTKEILIAPIKTKEYLHAVFIVSDLILPTEIKKPERETFLIICMYLSQCFDSIQLFEDLYHAKDDLEKKVKERTNDLVKSLRTIEAVNKAKSDFISSVSHELRTPLTSVKGFSSLLVNEKFGKLPEEAKKRLTKIDKNVNSLMAIVNTLLDISRIESGKMEVKIAPFEIAKLIKDVTDFLTPQVESKKLNLAVDIPENLNVYMDKSLIERVLINLINNAIKFTSENGEIKVACSQHDSQAVVSVSDTGCGMKKEDAEKVFQEFFRVPNPAYADIEGSGLGLSLVKRIIDIHKEKIWVKSEPGKGTTFYLTLKIAHE